MQLGGAPAQVRIMVADDNADITDSAAEIFELHGFQVARAYDGEAAETVAFAFCPHIAFLDIGMPRQNGYAVAKRLRGRFGKDILLVAVSGWGREEDKSTAYEAGFDIHHTKPVEAFDLVKLALRYCGSAR